MSSTPTPPLPPSSPQPPNRTITVATSLPPAPPQPASTPTSGPRRFDPRPAVPTLHPRKVRGGVRLEAKEGSGPLAWAGQRWMRLVEDCAPGHQLAEGMNYARLGQTRSLTILPGHIAARVQGRMPQAYNVDIRLPIFSHDQWEQAVGAMLEEARHIASLLSGDVPPGIDDLFAPLHLRLFPVDASDLALSCSCARAMPTKEAPGPWCKHVCCVMAIVAERLSREPFLIFALRGESKEDLLERIRQRRALLAAQGGGGEGPAATGRPVPAYSPRIPGVGEQPATPLELSIKDFWTARPELREVDLPIQLPDVSHPLLRRLGPSPFETAKFPLVGLLATCYEVISQSVLKAPDSSATPSSDADVATDEKPGDEGEGAAS